jgi:uncharacterized protein YuzE
MVLLEFDEEAAAVYLKVRKGKVASTEPLAENVIVTWTTKVNSWAWNCFSPRR